MLEIERARWLGVVACLLWALLHAGPVIWDHLPPALQARALRWAEKKLFRLGHWLQHLSIACGAAAEPLEQPPDVRSRYWGDGQGTSSGPGEGGTP
jgi:hypothetical protein